MLTIEKFKESDFEFEQIARIYNVVSHDDKDHPDDIKEAWAIRDKKKVKDKLLLYIDKNVVGFLAYVQGRDQNEKNCYFNIYLLPEHNGNGYRQLLFNKMLKEVHKFGCKRLYANIYEHNNYSEYKKMLVRNNFEVVLKIREYSLKLENFNVDNYKEIINLVDKKGIKFYNSRDEMSEFQDHYKKLEKLEWTYSQDFPVPEGTVITREPFKLWKKEQEIFENKHYGIEIIAVCNNQYIGSTDLHVYPKSDPYKAWTGGLGVIREYRRQGIATALKIKAIQALKDKGIKIIRTDNEENNPMYKININLGFKPEPFGIEYRKKIN